jgi:hypothetical protein
LFQLNEEDANHLDLAERERFGETEGLKKARLRSLNLSRVRIKLERGGKLWG